MRVFVCLALFVLIFVDSRVHAKEILFDAILGKIDSQTIYYSDLVRFRDVENIMYCTGLRTKASLKKQKFEAVINRFVDEELMHRQAKKWLPRGSRRLESAIKQIQVYEACAKKWSLLAANYRKAWKTESRLSRGDQIVLQELEKRLLINRFVREKLSSGRLAWLKEARLKSDISLYLD